MAKKSKVQDTANQHTNTPSNMPRKSISEKEMEQFQAKVGKDQKELRNLLQQRLQKAKTQHTRYQDELNALVSEAFRPPPSADSAERDYECYPRTAVAVNPKYSAAEEIMASSKSLIADYYGVEEMVNEAAKDTEQPIADGWKQDIERKKELLAKGRNKALRDVHKVLGVEVEGEGEGEQALEGEEDGEGELDYELLRSLKDMERGVERMVKHVPAEEMEH